MIPVAYQYGDHYVECDECGDPIEIHGPKGCTRRFADAACTCPAAFTRADVTRLRREAGLPAKYDTREM